MMSAACDGPDDCWFGGVGSQDPLGERVGAFHLHWNGTDLESRLRAAGARRSARCSSTAARCSRRTLVGRSPENRTEPVELAEPEPVPRLIHRVGDLGFENDPFVPAPLAGVPGRRDRAAGPGQRRHRTSGRSVAGRRRGHRRRSDGAVARPPRGGAPVRRRLPGAGPERRRVRADRPLRGRRRDPRHGRSARDRGPVRRSPQRQQQGDRRPDRRRRERPRPPACRSPAPDAAAPPGSPARRTNDCWMVTWARLALPLQRRHAARSATPTPPSRARSTSGRTSRRNSSSPTGFPSTTRSSSRRLRSS